MDIVKCIEVLRARLQRYVKTGLKECPTRTIFIDPLLAALGWDVCDQDEVEHEYPTVDGKSVDYAMKVNGKVVLLLEAKQLDDPLDDVKSITQVVGYAANDGVEWCVLTNGVKYQVYKASETASAPDKLLFEVCIHPADSGGMPTEELAEQFKWLSRESMAEGHLDQLGREVFTTSKVRKALERLVNEKSPSLIRLIRKTMADTSVGPAQVADALPRIWGTGKTVPLVAPRPTKRGQARQGEGTPRAQSQYTEAHHIEGKPNEVIELYRELDRFCHNLAPERVTKVYRKRHVTWAVDRALFCCARLQRSGLLIWVKTDPGNIDSTIPIARDVSKVKHLGIGDVELRVGTQDHLRIALPFVQESFEKMARQ